MSIIRRINWQMEDFMFDVIHDLLERGERYGLPNIGIFESRDELYFSHVPATTLSLSPEHLHAVVRPYDVVEGVARPGILVQFYFFDKSDKSVDRKITKLAELKHYLAPQEGDGLTVASLAVALYFFMRRGWFNATEEQSADDRVRHWASLYFSDYQDRAAELLKHFSIPLKEEENK